MQALFQKSILFITYYLHFKNQYVCKFFSLSNELSAAWQMKPGGNGTRSTFPFTSHLNASGRHWYPIKSWLCCNAYLLERDGCDRKRVNLCMENSTLSHSRQISQELRSFLKSRFTFSRPISGKSLFIRPRNTCKDLPFPFTFSRNCVYSNKDGLSEN